MESENQLGTQLPPPTSLAAGWYALPGHDGAERYFDGYRWTETIHRSTAFADRAAEPTLPLQVAIGGLVALAASLVVAPSLSNALDGLPLAVALTIAVVAAYLPSVVWLVFASRRWGSGNLVADYGIRWRWSDIGWGPLAWLGTLLAMGITLNLLEAADVPYRGNLDVTGVELTTATKVMLVITSVVVAPVVEEILFRGAVLRGLRSRVPVAIALVVQAAFFGFAHFQPEFGRDNLGLNLVLGVAGLSFGLITVWARRVGTAIVAHAVLNGVAITIALSGWEPAQ